MIDLRFVPIDQWPGEPTTGRIVSSFRVTHTKTLDDLEYELKHLSAHDIVIQAFISRSDLRNDGWPAKGAKFLKPGIILSFLGRDRQQISFPCDTYTHWECNLRAISLTLTSLRAIDRYGVSKRNEQYQGWKQLAAPGQAAHIDATWALDHLARLAQTTPRALAGNRAAIDLAYRSAVKRVHPDAGGTVEAFQLLQTAMEVLNGAMVKS